MNLRINYKITKNNIAALSVLFSLTVTGSYVHAMNKELVNETEKHAGKVGLAQEKDRSLYTKVIKNVKDPAYNLNIEYLRTLPRTLGKKDKIDFCLLFSAPENPRNRISGIALAILAGDGERVKMFLNTKSRANFNYSDDKKNEFTKNTQPLNSSLSSEEFIKKHLYTSEKMNPNDPCLYVHYDLWSPTKDLFGISFYSLVHLAINPYVEFQNATEKAPSYLPNFNEIEPESRLQVVDELYAAGADFNTYPIEYRKFFLDEVTPEIPFLNRNPLVASRLDNCFHCRTELLEELRARAFFYGADIEQLCKGLLEVDRNKIREAILQRVFNQILKGEIGNMCPMEDVRDALNKIKIEKIKTIDEKLEVEKNKGSITDQLSEKEKDLRCLNGELHRSEEDKQAKLQKLSNEKEHLSQLKF